MELLSFDLEPEKTLQYLLWKRRKRDAKIGDHNLVAAKLSRALKDYYTPSWSEASSCIRQPTIQANQFELKYGLIQTSYNFGGLPSEDPNEHVLRFIKVCNTQKYNRVTKEAL